MRTSMNVAVACCLGFCLLAMGGSVRAADDNSQLKEAWHYDTGG